MANAEELNKGLTEGLTNILDNPTAKTVISLVLALYAGAAAPALPNSVIRFFDTIVGKLIFTFLIAYVASKDTQIAIMLAVAFVVTLTIANNRRITEGYATFEGFVNAEAEEEFANAEAEEEFANAEAEEEFEGFAGNNSNVDDYANNNQGFDNNGDTFANAEAEEEEFSNYDSIENYGRRRGQRRKAAANAVTRGAAASRNATRGAAVSRNAAANAATRGAAASRNATRGAAASRNATRGAAASRSVALRGRAAAATGATAAVAAFTNSEAEAEEGFANNDSIENYSEAEAEEGFANNEGFDGTVYPADNLSGDSSKYYAPY